MTNSYKLIIYWSKNDDCFVAEVPELSGCMADGKTHQKSASNAEIVIQQWIDTAMELGRTIPVPKGRLAYA